jgi:hypothetical protein
LSAVEQPPWCCNIWGWEWKRRVRGRRRGGEASYGACSQMDATFPLSLLHTCNRLKTTDQASHQRLIWLFIPGLARRCFIPSWCNNTRESMKPNNPFFVPPHAK